VSEAAAGGGSAGGATFCAEGGGVDPDALSAPFVPRSAGGFCLDPQGEPKTYGEKGKFSMDDVCTTAFDGECEVYKRFDLDRVVVLRYVDGSGAPNSVEVNLSRFKTADGAYAMFTKRVVADGDPAKATVKPLDAGGAGATSSSNAYVWRGQYLVELTFVTEDAKMTPAAMARANEQSTGAIARDIGGRLSGAPEPPGPASALPTAERLPLGISYLPKDALGLKQIGPVAIGFYKDGEKRWRAIAMSRDGRFLYVSLRGDQDSLVVYSIARDTGQLSEIQRVSALGKTPWSIAIDPAGRWLFVANEASNSVTLFGVDPASGKLTATDASLSIPRPVAVTFYARRKARS